MRLVERLHFRLQDVEVLAALLERVHLPRRLLGQFIHLSEALVQRFERCLFLGQVVRLGEQRLDPLIEAVDFLVEREQVLLFRRQRPHAGFRVRHGRLQAAHAFVKRFELALSNRQRADFRADGFEQCRRVFLQLRCLALHVFVQLGRAFDPQIGVFGEFLDAVDGFFRLGRRLEAFLKLDHLRVHRPHHLAHAVGLDDGMFDGLLLALEGLGLACDVFGERVERREAFGRALAEFVELRQRLELLLDVLRGRHRRGRVFARFARGLADLAVVLRQVGRRRADLIEIAFQRPRLRERLLDLGL